MTKQKQTQERSIEELKAELEKLMKERFSLQMQKVTGQPVKTHLLKDIRRNVARIKTLLGQKGVNV